MPKPKPMIFRLALFIGLLFSNSSGLLSQIELGLSSGVSYASCEFSNLEVDSKGRFGSFISLQTKYGFDETFKAGINFNLVQKGYVIEGSLGDFDSRYTYLDINPVVEFVQHPFSFSFGPYVGFRLNEEFKNTNNVWISTKNNELIDDTDLGSAGMITFYHSNFHINLGYSFSWLNISNVAFTDMNGVEIENVRQRNRNITLGIGYTFKKKVLEIE